MYIVNDNSGDPANDIEAGIYEGYFCDQNSVCNHPSPVLTWLDHRESCNCYGIHTIGPASLDTDYPAEITQKDSSDWKIYLGSCDPCLSTNNSLSPNLIRAGTEATNQVGMTSCSAQKDLQFENASGVWSTNGWNNASQGDAYTEGDNGPHRYWVTPDSWLRDFAHGNNESYDQALAYCQTNAGW